MIMKKIYITPQTDVLRIEAVRLLSGSAKLDQNQEITNSDGFGSRGGYWDDED